MSTSCGWEGKGRIIPIADERVGVQVKLWNPLRTCAIPERFCGGDSLRIGAISSVCTFTFTFKPKHRFFGPRTAKSQPMWMKFCIHPLLYGIHLWVDLDRDRCVGGSRPNQNDCFVILVTHLKSYIETTDRRNNCGGKPSKWRCWRVLSWKIPEFYNLPPVEPDQKNTFFCVFTVPFNYPAHSLH